MPPLQRITDRRDGGAGAARDRRGRCVVASVTHEVKRVVVSRSGDRRPVGDVHRSFGHLAASLVRGTWCPA